MDAKELLKIVVLLVLYGMAPPLLGLVLRGRPHWQQLAFGAVCFMTIGGLLSAAEWGLTLQSTLYRGHARGYHFFFYEVLVLGLLAAWILEDWRRVRWTPPGLWLYLVYCGLSLLSICSAPGAGYVLMAAFKACKITLVFVVAYNFFRTEDDLHFFLRVMAATMFWQLLVVLKMKYIDQIYQVGGTFEHQNSLSMFTTMIAMVFLAASLGPPHPRSNRYLIAFVACAVIQQATLSRAGLAVFACGTLGVVLMGMVDKVTKRRLVVLSALAVVGGVGLALTLDTISARFQDYGTIASGKTRELLNVASRQMLRDYPLGIGWNNFALTINTPFPYGKVIDDWERAGGATVDENAPKGVVESLYWLLLAETGYTGFASFILMILTFLGWNLRGSLWFRTHFLGAVSLGVGMGCAANYAQSFLERVLTQPRNMTLWMILLAATARIETWRRTGFRQARKRRRLVEGRREQSGGAEPQPKSRGDFEGIGAGNDWGRSR